jgi:hypothetical protein
VFPALAASVELLKTKAPDEAENFRATITTMTAAAMRSHHGEPLPTEVEMARKIHNALDAWLSHPPSNCVGSVPAVPNCTG